MRLRDAVIKNKKTWYFLLFLTVMIVSIPLFSRDLIFAHDSIFHLQRIEGIKEGLSSGDFPVKLYGYVYNDYGYPAGYFYPDLFLYIPAFFRLIGLDVLPSYNFFLFLITVLTAVVGFISFNKLFQHINMKDELPHYVYGAVAAALYTGALYRLVDLYPRAAIGESLAMAFLPLAIVSFYLMLNGEKNAWIGVVIGATGILESHILSSLLLFVSYVLMSLVFFKRFFNKEVLHSVIKACIFTLLINLWFYAPFLNMYGSFDFQMKDMIKTAANMFVFKLEDSLRYRFFVGLLPISLALFYCIYLIIKKFKNHSLDYLDKIFLFCLFLCVILIILASSSTFWEISDKIPFLGEKLGVLQFSYRLTMFTSLFIAVALSIVICANKRFLTAAFIIPITSVFWMMSLPVEFEYYMTAIIRESNSIISDKLFELKDTPTANVTVSSLDPAHNPYIYQYIDYLHKDIADNEYKIYTNTRTLEYWEAVKNRTILKLDPYEITPKDAVTNFFREGLHLNFTTNVDAPTDIKLPLWYYPHSYGATCDGEEIPTFEVHHHRLAVTAPKGEHNIKVFPKLHTPYRNACIISLIGVLAFILVCVSTLDIKNNKV